MLLTVWKDGQQGRVDLVTRGDGFVSIEGYGFVKLDRRFSTPDRFIVFIDGDYVYQGAQNRMRSEFAREHRKNELARCGFQFRLTYEGAENSEDRDIAVFALYDESGSPYLTALEPLK